MEEISKMRDSFRLTINGRRQDREEESDRMMIRNKNSWASAHFN